MSSKLNAKKVRYTVSEAKDILANRNHCNRPYKEKWVITLVKDYRAGEWVEDNGDTLKFDAEGNLVDGQHRLGMLIALGKPLTFFTAYNVHPDAFRSLDQGKGRTLADALAIEGVSNWAIAAAAVNNYSRYHKGATGEASRQKVSLTEGLKVYRRMKSDVKFVASACANNSVGPPGLMAGMYLICRRIDRDFADEFYHGVLKGDNLKKASPIYLLRERLIKNKNAKEKVTSTTMIYWFLKSWNAWMDGEVIENMRITEEDYEATWSKGEE